MNAQVDLEVILRDMELSSFNAAALADASLQFRFTSHDEEGKEHSSDWVKEASGRHQWEYVNAISVPTDYSQIERGAVQLRLESVTHGELGTAAIGIVASATFVHAHGDVSLLHHAHLLRGS